MNKFILAIVALSGIMLSGCAVVPNEITQNEKENGITVYRQNIAAGAAATILFELNDKKYKIGPSDVVFIKPIIGGNFFKLTGIHFYGDSKVIEFSNQKFNLNYSDGQVIRLGVGFNEKTIVEIYKHNGELLKKYKFDYIKTNHKIKATPGNVIISYFYEEGADEKILFDYSSKNNDPQVFPVTVDSYPSENKEFKIKVKWKDFDDEIIYKWTVDAGVDSEKDVTPSMASKKYLQYLSNQLYGLKRIEFICSNGLNSKFTEYNKCVKYEQAQLEMDERKHKENQYNLEIKSKIATKEGVICEKKFKGFENKEAFFKCYWEETQKSFDVKKFLDALNSPEGKSCSKKSSKDNDVFWECYKQEVSNREKISNDIIAQQCISMGFEFLKNGYSECYLKLKIHTEQIEEWKKLQKVMETQRQNGNNISSIQNEESVARNLELARRGFESAYGTSAPPAFQPPPPPVRLVTPMGSTYNCSMMGASFRCR